MATITRPETGSTESQSPWRRFRVGLWQKELDVRDFIQRNYEPYEGDESFLTPATERTQAIWNRLNELFVEERRKGVLDVSQIPSSITAHAPGYIDRENEIIVRPPDRRATETRAHAERRPPDGDQFLKAYDYEPDPYVFEIFPNTGGRTMMAYLMRTRRISESVAARIS